MHKSGFVNIVGNPNVGKSTLMNVLVGEHLSIITHKAQTTRHRILGIVNGTHKDHNEAFEYQIVYSDTPGVIRPSYRLQEQMLQFSQSALIDADILLYVTDGSDKIDKNADFLTKVQQLQRSEQTKIPIIVVINKIDLINQTILDRLVETWNAVLPDAMILPISAKLKFGIEALQRLIISQLKPCPPFFDKDMLTDKSSRFFVGEIIREKILLAYDKEIPYSVEVEVESFEESDNLIRIAAIIYTERESQKGILIGKEGRALKKIATAARKDMETFFAKKIFLQVQVKVDADWRENTLRLQHYGYERH